MLISLLLVFIPVVVSILLWRQHGPFVKNKWKTLMQGKERQLALVREGWAFIDKGLKIEEAARAQGLKDDPISLMEARKAYH